MSWWVLAALIGVFTLGCGATSRNGEPESTSAGSASETSSTGSGDSGGSGGSSASSTSAGTLATGGGGGAPDCAPATGGELPSLEGGEYLIRGVLPEPVHLRFDSETTATLTSYFGGSEALQVERDSCASLESVQLGIAQYQLFGPILLNSASGAQRLALSEAPDGGVGSEAIVLQPEPCTNTRLAEATVEPDASPTEARALARFRDVLIPWEPIQLSVSKPPGVPLSESITLSAAGHALGFEVDDGSLLSLSDWPNLLGKTLELAADIVSTNGVASPFAVELPVVDLAASTSPLDTTAGAPNGSVLIGNATVLPPGDALCSEGCLGVGATGGFAFALSGNQATRLVVHYNGGIVEGDFGNLVSTTAAQISLAVPGGIPESHSLPGVEVFTAAEITLQDELAPDEVLYGLVTGASGKIQIQPGDGCHLADTSASVFLESIELVN